jgi:putative ABC transport system substrate-binding protein
MNRRDFITLLGGAAAWPLVARAQQPDRMRRIGVLIGYAESDREGQTRVEAFREALQKLGWTEGSNVQIDIRWTTNPVVRSTYAAGLVGSAPDVVLCSTTPVLQTLQKLTHSVPLVFVQVSDPVSAGFVSNLARPGGNVTGFTNFEYTIGGKWLEVLKEAAPKIDRAGVVVSRDDPSWSRYFVPIEAIAPSLDVQVTKIFLDDAAEIESALSELADGSSGVIVLPSGGASLYRELIAGLAARLRLPTIYPFRYYILSNGLMS